MLVFSFSAPLWTATEASTPEGRDELRTVAPDDDPVAAVLRADHEAERRQRNMPGLDDDVVRIERGGGRERLKQK
jgi:hypothetical protein